MFPLLLALALTAAPPSPPPPLATLDDVVALVRAGVPAKEVAARVRTSGAYLALAPEQAARLYLDAGVPAAVLAAVFATGGSPWPRVTGRPGELELLYDGYRIVGRRGPSGPTLVVSGWASDGARLKPPVEVAAERRDQAGSRSAVEADARSRETWYEPMPARRETPAWVEPRYEDSLETPRGTDAPDASWSWRDQRGAPGFVSYSQVPAGWITGGSITLPIGSGLDPSGYGYGGYGYGGYGGYGYATYSYSAPGGYGRGHYGHGSSSAGAPCAFPGGSARYTFAPAGRAAAGGGVGGGGRSHHGGGRGRR